MAIANGQKVIKDKNLLKSGEHKKHALKIFQRTTTLFLPGGIPIANSLRTEAEEGVCNLGLVLQLLWPVNYALISSLLASAWPAGCRALGNCMEHTLPHSSRSPRMHHECGSINQKQNSESHPLDTISSCGKYVIIATILTTRLAATFAYAF